MTDTFDTAELKRNPFVGLRMGDLEKEALTTQRGEVVARQITDANEPRDSHVRVYTGMWSGGFDAFCEAMLSIGGLLERVEELERLATKAVKQAEGKGMGDWPVFKTLRATLKGAKP